MNPREEHARMTRLRAVARQQPLDPDRIITLIAPFIDRYKNLRLAAADSPQNSSPHPRHDDIVRATLDIGAALHRQSIRGLSFHTGFQHALAALADPFGYRGFTECAADYDPPANPRIITPPPARQGRMDVVWAAARRPVVLFEIDRTVKRASLSKLHRAAADHKYWIYFGSDIWDFKTSLRRWDPHRTIHPIIIPATFTPRA